MTKVIYQGFFIDNNSANLLKQIEGIKRLEKEIVHQHITFKLHPKELFPITLIGKTFSVMVIGYGNNGENSGFEIALSKELIPYYKGADAIHITTSLSEKGKALNTRYLKFTPITPFEITGQMGFYTGKEVLFS